MVYLVCKCTSARDPSSLKYLKDTRAYAQRPQLLFLTSYLNFLVVVDSIMLVHNKRWALRTRRETESDVRSRLCNVIIFK